MASRRKSPKTGRVWGAFASARAGAARHSQVTGGVGGGLARHTVRRVQNVRDGATARAANPVALGAQLERLGPIQGPDGDQRRAVLLQELIRRCSEKRNRGDVIRD